MRKLAALGLVGGLILIAPQASARATKVRGPFLLVSLPALGTVTWRCDPSRRPGLAPGLPALALGYRAYRVGATEHLRFQAGRRTISRLIQPGQAIRLPYLRSRIQQLDVTQFSGAGTLRATVTVDFVPHGTSTYCYSYLPPRIDIHVLPRQ